MAMKSSSPLCSTQATSSYPPTAADFVYRKVLRQAIAAICKHAGFEAIESNVLELLTHMINSYILEIGVTTRQLTELAGRTIATPSDTTLALIELGTNVSEFPVYLANCCARGALVIAQPKVQNPPVQPTPLKVGNTRPHHPHIPDTFPSFPDPHTYIRTEISGDPDLTYENVREQAAQAKRNVEISLKDFMLRIHPSVPLFREFEEKVRKEAQQILEDRARLKRSHLLARQDELDTRRLNQELKNGVDEEMPDIFDTENEQTSLSKEEEEAQLNGHMEDIFAAEMFELEETENSLVRRRVPAMCQIIEPSLDNRPYLSALLCDELGDDGADAPPSPPAPHPNHNAATTSSGNEETAVEENPYLRPPRMPSKSDSLVACGIVSPSLTH